MDELDQHDDYLLNRRAELAPFIPSDATRILDVGCGMGGWGVTLREKLPDATIVGIDPVASSVEASQKLGVYDEVHHGYYPADLPAVSAGFDTVFFNDVLEHVYDPWEMLRDTHERVQPGARVVAAIPSIQYAPVLAEVLKGHWEYTDSGTLDRTHVRFFTRSTMIELLESTGFAVQECVGVNPVPAAWYAEGRIPARLAKRVMTRVIPDSRFVHFVVTGVAQPQQSPNRGNDG